jgi:vesicle transport through interaction with t-SNAREs protein 1
MSVDILRNYEQQFGVLCAEITNKISRSVSLADKKSAIQKIDGLFQEARELIEQMELEIRDTSSKRTPEQKEKYLNIINSYKSELDKLELESSRQLKQSRTNLSDDAQFEIHLNEASKEENELNDLRQENQASMNKMNNKLENGYRMILESEETGKSILSDLFGQRETLQRTRDRLREANLNLGKSSRLAGTMTLRLIQNKIILFGIISFLVLFVLLFTYWTIKRKLAN